MAEGDLFFLPAWWLAVGHAAGLISGMYLALYVGSILHSEKLLFTSCGPGHYEFWPSISTTIGDNIPDRQIWRVFFVISSILRVPSSLMFFDQFLQHGYPWRSSSSGILARLLHVHVNSLTLTGIAAVCELLCTLGALMFTMVASIEHCDYHNVFFVIYIITNFAGHVIVNHLVKVNEHNPQVYTAPTVAQRSLWWKRAFIGVETLATLGVIVFFTRHKMTCANGSYSLATMNEWAFATSSLCYYATYAFELQHKGLWFGGSLENTLSRMSFYPPGMHHMAHTGDVEETDNLTAKQAPHPQPYARDADADVAATAHGSTAGLFHSCANSDTNALSKHHPPNAVSNTNNNDKEDRRLCHAFKSSSLVSSSSKQPQLQQSVRRITLACAPYNFTMWMCDVYWLYMCFEMIISVVKHMYYMPLVAMSISWEMFSLLCFASPALLCLPCCRRWLTSELFFTRALLSLIAHTEAGWASSHGTSPSLAPAGVGEENEQNATTKPGMAQHPCSDRDNVVDGCGRWWRGAGGRGDQRGMTRRSESVTVVMVRAPPTYLLLYLVGCVSHMHILVRRRPELKVWAATVGPCALTLATFVRFLHPTLTRVYVSDATNAWGEVYRCVQPRRHTPAETGAEEFPAPATVDDGSLCYRGYFGMRASFACRMLYAIPLSMVAMMLIRIGHLSESAMLDKAVYNAMVGIVLGLYFTLCLFREAMFDAESGEPWKHGSTGSLYRNSHDYNGRSNNYKDNSSNNYNNNIPDVNTSDDGVTFHGQEEDGDDTRRGHVGEAVACGRGSSQSPQRTQEDCAHPITSLPSPTSTQPEWALFSKSVARHEPSAIVTHRARDGTAKTATQNNTSSHNNSPSSSSSAYHQAYPHTCAASMDTHLGTAAGVTIAGGGADGHGNEACVYVGMDGRESNVVLARAGGAAAPSWLLGVVLGLYLSFCLTFYNCANYLPRQLALKPYPASLLVVTAFAAGLYYSSDVVSTEAGLAPGPRHSLRGRRRLLLLLLRRGFRPRWLNVGVIAVVGALVMTVSSRETFMPREVVAGNPTYPIQMDSPREHAILEHWTISEPRGSVGVAFAGALVMTFCVGALGPVVLEATVAQVYYRRVGAALRTRRECDEAGRRGDWGRSLLARMGRVCRGGVRSIWRRSSSRSSSSPSYARKSSSSRFCAERGGDACGTAMALTWYVTFIAVVLLYVLCTCYPFVPASNWIRERSRTLSVGHTMLLVVGSWYVARRRRPAAAAAAAVGMTGGGGRQSDLRQPSLHVVSVVIFVGLTLFVCITRFFFMPADHSVPAGDDTALTFPHQVMFLHRAMMNLTRARNARTDSAMPGHQRGALEGQIEQSRALLWQAVVGSTESELAAASRMSTLSYAERVAVWTAASALSPLSCMIWTVHFGMDNYNVDSLERMLGQIRRTGADVVGLLETETLRLTSGNRDMVEYLSYHLGFRYTDYGPTGFDNTFGCALLTRYPIVRVRRHVLPSPLGELSCLIYAELNVYGIRMNVYVSHFGNTQHWADGLLQSQSLGELVRRNPGPSVFLGYLVTFPGNREKYHRYTDPHMPGLMRDTALELYVRRPWKRLVERGGFDETPPAPPAPGAPFNEFDVEQKIEVAAHLEEIQINQSFRRLPGNENPRHFYYNDTNRYTIWHPRYEFLDRYCEYILYKTGKPKDETEESLKSYHPIYTMELFDWNRDMSEESQQLSDTEIQIAQFRFELANDL